MKMPHIDRATDALIVVDVQNDFCPAQTIEYSFTFGKVGGALAVPEGDQVVPIINQLMQNFDFVIATQDWHPPDHISFASQHPGGEPFTEIELTNGRKQMLWPDHCIAGTQGADFSPALETTLFTHIVRKAYLYDKEAYSGFPGTGLGRTLPGLGIRRVFVCGLATDYCVKATALDSAKRDFETFVILPACRGVAENTTELAKNEMRRESIHLIERL